MVSAEAVQSIGRGKGVGAADKCKPGLKTLDLDSGRLSRQACHVFRLVCDLRQTTSLAAKENVSANSKPNIRPDKR